MQYYRQVATAIVLTFVLGSFQSFGQIKTAGEKKISIVVIDDFIKSTMDSLQMPGVSIAVINGGKIVYQRALGIGNLETRTKVNQESVFEAASLSKPVFTYFVLKMIDKGLLSLDTPLYKYMPYSDIEKDERYKLITARMALTHQTGFPNWRYFEKADSNLNVKYGDLYLKFTPGTRFAYSGEGYLHLAKVIAYLTNTNIQGLDNVFQNETSKPLGLQHLYFSGNDYICQHKVSGHKKGKVSTKKWPVSFPDQDSSWFGAAGGLHTNATNYANFLIALMNGKDISEALINEMLSPQIQLPKTSAMVTEEGYSAWGLGIAIRNTPFGILHQHGGNNGDFQSGFVIDKRKKWGFVFFTNCDKGNEFYKKLQSFLVR